MNTTLLIMAAGIGSRFGTGIKQLEPVDASNHIIMDYSIHDAIEAGFNHVVFIIRKDIEKEFKEVIGDRIAAICSAHNVTVDYWFKLQNDDSNGKLRKIIRLSKMFCKSRKSWKNMPSGLLQTVLCDEKLQQSYERTDELFYYTMQEIVNRLETSTSVIAPVDDGRDLTPRNIDHQRMTNWKNRLKSKLEDLEVLFSEDCTKDDAIQAWYGFFNHDYWGEQVTMAESYAVASVSKSVCDFFDGEQYIEEMYPMRLVYQCDVSCKVSGDGWRPKPIREFLSMWRHYLPHNFEIRCEMEYTDCPWPYKILWKVKNVGPEAERKNQIRGQIEERGRTIVEHTSFFGNHYIECYIVKDGSCMARKRIEIPIARR